MISVVDDDAFVRDSVGELLTSLGYGALVFDSAEQFLESGEARNTSCLITDVQMPGLSGLELQDQLQKEGCATPIIFMSAFPNEKCKTQALRKGAVAFLAKPFKDEKLITSIEIALKLTNGNGRKEICD